MDMQTYIKKFRFIVESRITDLEKIIATQGYSLFNERLLELNIRLLTILKK